MAAFKESSPWREVAGAAGRALPALLLAFAVPGCATATRFVLDLPASPPIEGDLKLLPLDMRHSNSIWVTGYGPRQQGAFSGADAAVFDASLRDTLIRNRIVRNVLPAPTEPEGIGQTDATAHFLLNIILLNHVLAGNEGGVMEVRYGVDGPGTRLSERFAVYCAYSQTMRIFDCLNRAVAYRVILNTGEAIRKKQKTPLTEFSGARYYDSAMEAASSLPRTITTVRCILWENTIFGPLCTDSIEVNLQNIDWKTFIKEPDDTAP